MNFTNTVFMAALAATALSVPALAQEADFQLPEQCTTSAGMGGSFVHGPWQYARQSR